MCVCVRDTRPAVDFKESRTRVIRFPEVEAVVLEKVCQYMYHHQRTKSAVGSKKRKALRGMDGTASFDIEPDIVVKMLLFASFLDL